MMSSTLVTIKGKSKVNLEGEEGSRQGKKLLSDPLDDFA